MSRAEAFLEWAIDYFREAADFCTHYFMGGYNLWGNPWVGFLSVVALVGAVVIHDLSSDLARDESRFNAIRDAAGSALIIAPIFAVPLWFPLNILLGFFFGPVRP